MQDRLLVQTSHPAVTAAALKRLPSRRTSWLVTALTTIVAAMTFAAVLPGPTAARGPQSVAPIAAELGSAVVNISTAQRIKRKGRKRKLPRVPKGSPFEDLFEDFFEDDKGEGRRKVSSLGSGFVIDGREGLIVTNNHVIEGADEITIIFKDGRKLRVDKVLGIDKKTDLALLKVTPEKPLPEVKFGSSERIRVGDWVLAIGNPFGLGGSVSVGIISAKERDIKTGPYDDFLQTDAAINKGNSGGPLFNMDGQVIGVNTAIISPSGGSIGIGFAVPSDIARVVLDQLRRFGETRRGWLGVNVQSVTDEIAKSVGVIANTGAFVSTVAGGGPAASGGIQPGDVILSFDGKPIRSMRVLPRLVAQTEEGARVDVEFIRDGKRMSKSIVIGRLKEPNKDKDKKAKTTEPDASAEREAQPAPTGPVLGLTLKSATPELIKQFSHKDGAKGLVVTEMKADSDAARKGIAVGDVLAEVDSTRLSSLAQFADA
ncbi:MAG: Do family serine endopeptidase, partial [Pseudomonadota bacterium]